MRRLVGVLSYFLLSGNLLGTRAASASQAQAPQQIPAVVSDVILSELYAAQTAGLRSAAEERGEKFRIAQIRSLKSDGLSFVSFAIASKPTGCESWVEKGSLVAQVTADSSGHTQVEAFFFEERRRKAETDVRSIAAQEADFTIPYEVSQILLGKDFSDKIAEMAREYAAEDLRLEISNFSVSKGFGIFAFLGLRSHESGSASGSGKSIGTFIGEFSADNTLSRLEFKPAYGTTGAIGVSN